MRGGRGAGPQGKHRNDETQLSGCHGDVRRADELARPPESCGLSGHHSVGTDLGRVGGGLALVCLGEGEHPDRGGITDADGNLLTRDVA